MFLVFALSASPAPADPAGFDWKMLMVFVGVIILMFIMPRIIRRSVNERRELLKQCDREVAGQMEIKNQVDQIMVELVEAGQEINARLDTKMRVLNRLIRDAETVAARIERLAEIIERHPAAPEVAPGNIPDSNAAPVTSNPAAAHNQSGARVQTAAAFAAAVSAATTPPHGFDPTKDTVLMNPAQGRPTLTAANVAGATTSDSGRWRQDIRQKIEQHHCAHRTPSEIARLLHLSLSEVNLVIDMYEARCKNG